jgi:tetratricopeptide (TPR) repeat protein
MMIYEKENTIIGKGILWIMVLVLVAACNPKSVPVTAEKEVVELTRKEEISYQYALTEGMKKKITGNLREAITYFSECIRINPQSDAALYELSSIFTMAGNYREATNLLFKAYKIDPRNIWYQLQLANLYHALGKKDSTIIMYEELHKNFPERNDLYFDLATLYGEYGQEKKALEILEELEMYYGVNEKILLAKQQTLANAGKIDLAVEEIKKLIHAYPEEIRFYGILAEVYSTGNMNEKARETYDRLFEIDPNNGMGLLSVIEFYKRLEESENLFNAVNKLIDNEGIDVNQKIQVMIPFFTSEEFFTQHPREIKNAITKLKSNYPKDLRIRTLKADYHVKVEEFIEASEELNYVTEREKTNYVIWEQLLYVENAIGAYDNLYQHAQEAKKLFPGAPNVYLLHGVAAMELGKNSEAIQSFQRGLGLANDNIQQETQFYSMLGEVYNNDGNHQMSDQMFEKALDIDGENLVVLNNYSYYLSLREENLENALEMSKKCIIKEPENATYLDTYAWILFKMKKYEEAKNYIEKAIRNNGSTDGDIVEHYGDILNATGEEEKALIQWKKAKELGQSSSELIEKIEKAEKKRQI